MLEEIGDYYRILLMNLNILDNDKNISFIGLIYSGIDFNTIDYNDELIYLNPSHDYYFSTQITIWRKQDLIDLFIYSNSLFGYFVLIFLKILNFINCEYILLNSPQNKKLIIFI